MGATLSPRHIKLTLVACQLCNIQCACCCLDDARGTYKKQRNVAFLTFAVAYYCPSVKKCISLHFTLWAYILNYGHKTVKTASLQLYLYIYMYMYIYVSICICISIYLYVYLYLSISISIYINLYIYICTYIYTVDTMEFIIQLIL